MTALKWAELDKNSSKQKHQKVHPELPVFLRLFFPISYMLGAFYSLYAFYHICQLSAQSLPLTRRESYFGSNQDQLDVEWTIFSPVIVKCLPYYLAHLICSQCLKKFVPQVLALFYIVFSSTMLFIILGLHGTLICYAVVMMMFAVMVKRRKHMIWLMWCIILILLNTRQFTENLGIWLEDVTDGEYLTSVIVAWIILRSLSFSLETCEEDPYGQLNNVKLFVTCLSYCLYFPLVLTGPYMPYTDYQNGLAKPYEQWTLSKIRHLLCSLLHFYVIMIVTDVSLHYFYAHSMYEFPMALINFNAWALAGFVYYLLVFFFFKYIVFYGISGAFSRYDGYSPPRHPRCVLAVYKGTDVWRYFDLGLYKFMVRHIYLPFIGEERTLTRQLQGSVIVFTFIYVWHGVSNSVFWWAVFNFIGVTMEKAFDRVLLTESYKYIQVNYLYGYRSRLFLGIFYAMFIFNTVISMVIFVSSLDNAKVVFRSIFIWGFPDVTLTTFFFMYCIAQCGVSCEKYRKTDSTSNKS